MRIPRTSIARVITDKLGRESTKKLSQDVGAYLLETGRVGELDSLLRDVMQQRAEGGIVEAIASSAHPLNAQGRSDVKAQVKKVYPRATQIIVSEQLDPELVGGVKIELANQQLDLSVRSKLNRFKQLTVLGE